MIIFISIAQQIMRPLRRQKHHYESCLQAPHEKIRALLLRRYSTLYTYRHVSSLFSEVRN
jgi:hypothetical protein